MSARTLAQVAADYYGRQPGAPAAKPKPRSFDEIARDYYGNAPDGAGEPLIPASSRGGGK